MSHSELNLSNPSCAVNSHFMGSPKRTNVLQSFFSKIVVTRDACPPLDPNSFIFMQFSAKFLQDNRLVDSSGVGAPWEILEPPLVMSDIVNNPDSCVVRAKQPPSCFTEQIA